MERGGRSDDSPSSVSDDSFTRRLVSALLGITPNDSGSTSRWLRLWPLGPILLALLLVLPGLGGDFGMDDRWQEHALSGSRVAAMQMDAWDLYRIWEPHSEARNGIEAWGGRPWYADPNARIMFLRPLTSLSRALDHQLAAGSMVFAQVHNLLWFVGLTLGLVHFYRRWFPDRRVAGLALLVFVIADIHSMALLWPSGRHLLISSTFMIWGCLAHLRWRETNWRAGALLGPLAYGAALLAGESTLSLVPLVLVTLLLVEPRTPRTSDTTRRTTSLWIYAALTGGYLVAHVALGYGPSSNGLYVSPFDHAGDFARAVLVRLPYLMLGLLTPVIGEAGLFGEIHPDKTAALATLAWVCVAGIAVVLYRRRRHPPTLQPLCAALVVGLIPLCGGLAQDRVLLGPSIAGSAIVASLYVAAKWPDRSDPTSTSPWLARTIFTLHVALPMLLSPAKNFMFSQVIRSWDMPALSLSNVAFESDDTIVLLTTPGLISTAFLPVYRAELGLSVPGKTLQVVSTHDASTITRIDDTTLRIETRGKFCTTFEDAAVRRRELEFRVGEQHRIGPMTLTVVRVDSDGHPTAIELDLAGHQDGSSIKFAHWAPTGFEPLTLPQRGKSLELPATSPYPPAPMPPDTPALPSD